MKIRITKVVLTNFKSYYGRVEVAINESFVCIVGKNGSGKSAFMDALCWVFGFRSQSLRSENTNQLINDKSKREGNTETKVEVQFTLYDTAISSSVNTFNQLLTFLKNPPFVMNGSSTITIGRCYHNHSLEYIGRFQKSPQQIIKYSDIKELLESLSIQINIKGKFIIQQSTLLLSIRQKNTTLLDIIEESIGNQTIIKQLDDLRKKEEDLKNQKEVLSLRKEAIEKYRIEKEKEYELEKKRVALEEEETNMKTDMERIDEERRESMRMLMIVELEEKEKKEVRMKESLEKWKNEVNKVKEEGKELMKKKEVQEQEFEQWRRRREEAEDGEKEVNEVKDQIKQKQKILLIHLDKQQEIKKKQEEAEMKLSLLQPCEMGDEVIQFGDKMKVLMELMEQREGLKREETKKEEVVKQLEQELKKKPTENINNEEDKETLQNTLREEYNTMEREICDLMEVLAQASPPVHPKQRLIDLFVKNTHPSDSLLLFASLPITILNPRTARAVNLILQPFCIQTVIVSTRQTASSFIQFTNSINNKDMIKCIIMEEMGKTRPHHHHSKTRLIDCIQYPQEFKSMLEQMIGNWLVCETDNEAIEVQKREDYWNCITLEGIQYLSKGEVRREKKMIEYPFPVTGKRVVNKSERQVFESSLQEKKIELERVKERLNEVEKRVEERRVLREKTANEKREYLLLERRYRMMEEELDQLKMKIVEVEQGITQLKERIPVELLDHQKKILEERAKIEESRLLTDLIDRNQKQCSFLKTEQQKCQHEIEELKKQRRNLKIKKDNEVGINECKRREEREKNNLHQITVDLRSNHLRQIRLEQRIEEEQKNLCMIEKEIGEVKEKVVNHDRMKVTRKEVEKKLKVVNEEWRKVNEKVNEIECMITTIKQQIHPDVIDRLQREDEEYHEIESILSVVDKDIVICLVYT